MPVQPISIVLPPTYNVLTSFPNINVSVLAAQLCHNYSIEGEQLCLTDSEEAPEQTYTTFYFEINEWNPITKENIIVAEENDAGDRRTKYFRQKRFISFQGLVDDFHLNVLYNFELFQKWTITRVANGGTFELSSFEVGNPSPVRGGYHQVTITMGIKGGDSVIDSCCGSAYAGAPYEDCTDAEGTPQPPIECADYMLNALVYDAVNMTLTASTTGQPPGTTETFKWYYFKDASSPVIILTTTAAVINVTEPGTYRAIGTAGVCQTAPEDFLLMDDCGSFAALIGLDDGYIVLQPNRISTIEWTLDDVPIAETGLVFRPSTSGTYEATVTSGTCEVVVSIVVDLEDCDFIITLGADGDLLTVSHDYVGVGTVLIQWYKDTGSGETIIAGATGVTYQVTEAGNYIVEVTIGTCTQRANQVMLGSCFGFNPYIEYVIESGGDILLMSGHTGAPGDVTIEWWQIRNGEWTIIGVGASITTDEEGPTKLVATSEGCRKERFTQACIDPANPEWEERETATAAQTIFDKTLAFTEIDLANISALISGGYSEEDIDARWELYKNGAKLVYKHEANLTHRSEWTVNASGDLELAWPSNAGDVFVLIRRYIP
jgi:hypothetical protein